MNQHNKYFTKGKTTQRIARAISRGGEKAITVLRNVGAKVNAKVGPAKNKIANVTSNSFFRTKKTKIPTMTVEQEAQKLLHNDISAMKFDNAVLGMANVLERRKIISPRQAAKVRIAVAKSINVKYVPSYLHDTKTMQTWDALYSDARRKIKTMGKDPIINIAAVANQKKNVFAQFWQPKITNRQLLNQIRELHHGHVSDKETKEIARKIKQQAELLPPVLTERYYKGKMVGYRRQKASLTPIYRSRIQERANTYEQRENKALKAYEKLGDNYKTIRNAALKTKRVVPKVALGLAAAKAIQMLMDKQNKEKP